MGVFMFKNGFLIVLTMLLMAPFAHAMDMKAIKNYQKDYLKQLKESQQSEKEAKKTMQQAGQIQQYQEELNRMQEQAEKKYMENEASKRMSYEENYLGDRKTERELARERFLERARSQRSSLHNEVAGRSSAYMSAQEREKQAIRTQYQNEVDARLDVVYQLEEEMKREGVYNEGNRRIISEMFRKAHAELAKKQKDMAVDMREVEKKYQKSIQDQEKRLEELDRIQAIKKAELKNKHHKQAVSDQQKMVDERQQWLDKTQSKLHDLQGSIHY